MSFNPSNRLVCQTIRDRGIAMILLPRWGCTLDWRSKKKKEVGSSSFTHDSQTFNTPSLFDLHCEGVFQSL